MRFKRKRKSPDFLLPRIHLKEHRIQLVCITGPAWHRLWTTEHCLTRTFPLLLQSLLTECNTGLIDTKVRGKRYRILRLRRVRCYTCTIPWLFKKHNLFFFFICPIHHSFYFDSNTQRWLYAKVFGRLYKGVF